MIIETNIIMYRMENLRNVSWKQWLDYSYSSGPRSGSVWWFWSGTETRVEVTLLLNKRPQNLNKNVNKFDRKSVLSVDFLFRQMPTRNSKSFTYLLIFWHWHSVDVINNKSASEVSLDNCKLLHLFTYFSFCGFEFRNPQTGHNTYFQ